MALLSVWFTCLAACLARQWIKERGIIDMRVRAKSGPVFCSLAFLGIISLQCDLWRLVAAAFFAPSFLLVDTSERCCSHISTYSSVKSVPFASASFPSADRLQPFLSAFFSASAHDKSQPKPLTLGTVKYKYFPIPHLLGDAFFVKSPRFPTNPRLFPGGGEVCWGLH